jgi:hypothetical protein
VSHYVIVTGGRDADDVTLEDVRVVLTFLNSFYGGTLRVLHGAAKGVDARAAEVCDELGVGVKAFPADWGRGNQAGLERNEKMARLVDSWMGPEHTGEVIAFRGGRGTAHMCSMAERFHIPLTQIPGNLD